MQKAFLSYPHYATVATLNADGSPQLSLVWFARDGASLVFTTAADSLKARSLRRNPAASLLINHGGRYVSVRGTAQVGEDTAEGEEWLRRIALRYYDEEEGLRQFAHLRQTPTILVRVVPLKISAVGL